MFLENYQSLVHFCRLGFDNGVVCLSRKAGIAELRLMGTLVGSGESWVELDTDRLAARELKALDLLKFPCGQGQTQDFSATRA